MKIKKSKKMGMSKRKYQKRPIIRITSDHLNILSVVLDGAILLLLFIWLILELGGIIR